MLMSFCEVPLLLGASRETLRSVLINLVESTERHLISRTDSSGLPYRG
jgi:hypothetical protein